MFSSVQDRVVDIESYAKKMQRWGSCGLTSNVQNATTTNSSVLEKAITRHLRTGYSSDDDRLRQYQAGRLRVKLDLRVSASELLQLSHSPSASLGHTIKLLQLTIRCFQSGLAH